MSVNVTIDDSSADIQFSDDWSTQLPNDPNLSDFFMSTYHTAQASGSTANITFVGSAAYLYGSMGPGHSNYSVQFDDLVIVLNASRSELSFQQPLFAFTFPSFGQHFISLQAIFTDEGNWLDLDFITLTLNGTTTTSQAVNPTPTILPPWLTASSASPTSSSQSSSFSSWPSGNNDDNTNTSAVNNTTLILTILFGVILGLAALALIFAWIFGRYRKRRYQREQQFRLGTKSIHDDDTQRSSKYMPADAPSKTLDSPSTPIFRQVFPAHEERIALQDSRLGVRAGSRAVSRAGSRPDSRAASRTGTTGVAGRGGVGRITEEETEGVSPTSPQPPRSTAQTTQTYAFPTLTPTQQTFNLDANNQGRPSVDRSNQGPSSIARSNQGRPSVDRSNQSGPPTARSNQECSSSITRSNQSGPSIDRVHGRPSIGRNQGHPSIDRNQSRPSVDRPTHNPPSNQAHLRDVDQTFVRTESPHSVAQSQHTSVTYPVSRLIPNRPPPIPNTSQKGPPPPRPRRPSNNLLDWLGGNRFEKTIGQAAMKRKASNGNSMKSNFLSFSE